METSTSPSSMRAVLHTQSSQALSFDSHLVVPAPESDEYLIKVSASAITSGELVWPRPAHLDTSVPGVEMAGRVLSTPSSASNPKFKPGDKVYMRTTHPRAGSAREYTIALESELAIRPNNISAIQAAAVPVAALTAWQGLFTLAGLKLSFESPPASEASSLSILVNGASSATGLFFVQLASLAGYSVTGVCSAKNIAIVRELGAKHTIDYTTASIPRASFDVVFDCAGISTSLWESLKQNGRLYTIVPPFDLTRPEEWRWDLDPPQSGSCAAGISGKFFIMEAKGEDLRHITSLIEQEKLQVPVDSVWELEDYEGAFQRLASKRAVGKVVFKVADEE